MKFIGPLVVTAFCLMVLVIIVGQISTAANTDILNAIILIMGNMKLLGLTLLLIIFPAGVWYWFLH